MREKLNGNPLAQVALIGALLVAAILALTMMRGGGESEAEESEAPVTTAEAPVTATSASAVPSTGEAALSATAAVPPVATSPPPKAVTAAYDSGETVVLLIVREGGIDDQMVEEDAAALSSVSDVALFVVPSQEIARYAAIAEGAGVNRVPALVVMRPKSLSKGTPTASVSYGYQDSESVIQQVVDARYKGRTLSYHP
jgi:ABC-type proline/glycine betaine transport system substrate-binding protein